MKIIIDACLAATSIKQSDCYARGMPEQAEKLFLGASTFSWADLGRNGGFFPIHDAKKSVAKRGRVSSQSATNGRFFMSEQPEANNPLKKFPPGGLSQTDE